MGTDTNTKICSECGTENSATARFCHQCATPFGESVASTAEAAERKQVTVLFADLTGFTSLTEKLDPEETRQIMGSIFERAAGIVQRYDGRIEKFVGDAIMAIFGVPRAHEDDPHRAVRAAIELHAAVDQLGVELKERTGTALGMHSGVNTGVVVTGELQIDHGIAGPLGDTINTAARLMNAAPAGQIWVGPETAALIAAEFSLKDEGLVDFKGKAQPLQVASIATAGQSRSSPTAATTFRSAFVGRQAELGALLGAAEKMRDGQQQAFGICGDAGSGKSRLITEFRMQLGDEVNWLEGRAYSYSADIPYAPLIDLMRRIWGIEGADNPATVRSKIEAGLAVVFGADQSDLPLFLHLFDLPQDDGTVIERESFRGQLETVMQHVFAGLSRLSPTVICFQDLHWSDPSTRELVGQMALHKDSPIMVLANYRPGYTPPVGMQEISLTELSPRQTGEMLNSLLGGDAPEGLSQFVTERCDGNPFYVEEVVNSLRETGLLLQEEQRWVLSGALTESSVPATIRGVIAARIDRLDDARRRLLREAAVVGREFLVKVVELVGTNIDDLAGGLGQLQAADLIRQGRLEPSLAYMFKHALTQDVAYEGLLKSDRQVLHSRTASAIEQVFGDRIGEYVETLAYHFQRGGDVDKAVQYMIQAGTKCLERYALAEADKHFRDAYTLCSEKESTTEQKHTLTRLLVSWAQLHYYMGTVDEWIGLFKKHLPDAEACGDDSLLTQYLAWMGNVLMFHGDMAASEAVLDRGYLLGTKTGNKGDLAFVSAYRMYTMFERFRLTEAIELGRSIDYPDNDKTEGKFRYFKGRSALALALAGVGQFKASQEISEELIEIGRRGGSSRALVLGYAFLSWGQLFALNFEGAHEFGRQGYESATDPLYKALCANNQMIALACQMKPDPILALSKEWGAFFEHNGNNWHGAHAATAAASAGLVTGDLSAGLKQLQAAVGLLQGQGAKASSCLTEAFLALTYVSIARMDVKPSAKSLISNPWFVTTQVPFAAAKARAMIPKIRETIAENNLLGLGPLLDLIEGRLMVHLRKTDAAADALGRIRKQLEAQGFDSNPIPVADLAAEVANLR